MTGDEPQGTMGRVQKRDVWVRGRCAIAADIDGSVYQSHNLNIHRPTNIEGYCGGIAKGKVKVGFKIKAGECGGGYNYCDAWTSWNQANRIIIEEVEPPVA